MDVDIHNVDEIVHTSFTQGQIYLFFDHFPRKLLWHTNGIVRFVKHTYKICPSCLFFCETSEEDNYCSICGKELLTKCQSCGQPFTNPYAKYCKHCGSKFPDRSIKLKRII